jgi:hypothetical protein
MIMAAIGHAFSDDRLRCYFTLSVIEQAIRPILPMEEFAVGRARRVLRIERRRLGGCPWK